MVGKFWKEEGTATMILLVEPILRDCRRTHGLYVSVILKEARPVDDGTAAYVLLCIGLCVCVCVCVCMCVCVCVCVWKWEVGEGGRGGGLYTPQRGLGKGKEGAGGDAVTNT